MQKPPVKKIFAIKNPFNERLRLNKYKKVQTVDAWTQTTPRADNEESMVKRELE